MSEIAHTSGRSSVVVDAPIERAFAVFTDDIGSWWPPEHHILQSKLAEMVWEPRAGGHVYDRGVDGTEFRWARVELEHRNIDRRGDGWEPMRDGVDAPEGWDMGLARLAARLETSAAGTS
jgi:hypothetical protein